MMRGDVVPKWQHKVCDVGFVTKCSATRDFLIIHQPEGHGALNTTADSRQLKLQKLKPRQLGNGCMSCDKSFTYCAVLVRFPIRFPASPGTVVSLRVFNFYLNIFHLHVRWLHSIFGPRIFSTQPVIIILQVKCHHSVNFTCSGLYNWLVNGLAMDSRKNLRTPLVPNSGRSHCSCRIPSQWSTSQLLSK